MESDQGRTTSSMERDPLQKVFDDWVRVGRFFFFLMGPIGMCSSKQLCTIFMKSQWQHGGLGVRGLITALSGLHIGQLGTSREVSLASYLSSWQVGYNAEELERAELVKTWYIPVSRISPAKGHSRYYHIWFLNLKGQGCSSFALRGRKQISHLVPKLIKDNPIKGGNHSGESWQQQIRQQTSYPSHY